MISQDEADADRRARVAARAEHLWRADGSPSTGPDAYRDLASELIAIEEAEPMTHKSAPRPGPYGEPVEPTEPVEDLGEFPTTTDQSEQEYPPGEREEDERD